MMTQWMLSCLFKNLLEQPISPERLSSLTQGYPSTTLYMEFWRSGTDSIKSLCPEFFRAQGKLQNANHKKREIKVKKFRGTYVKKAKVNPIPRKVEVNQNWCN